MSDATATIGARAEIPCPAAGDAAGTGHPVSAPATAATPPASRDAPKEAGVVAALDAMNSEFDDIERRHGTAHAVRVRELVSSSAVAFDADANKVASDTSVPVKVLTALRATFLREQRKAESEATKAAQSAPREGNGAGSAVLLPDREPWPDVVDGERLVAEIAALIERQVMLAPGAAVACAVWVVHTYVFEGFAHTPRLAITSPLPRCGKTTLLNLLYHLAQRPLSAANLTAAVVFRVIEHLRPTLAVDEADTFLAEDEALRGVLNAGHGRGGQVIRLVGDQHEPKAFNVFGPVAIAMIGKLPATLEDRSIKIEMRRKTAAETRARSTRATDRAASELARKCARWALDNAAALDGDAEPVMPAGLHDRAADNWRTLFIIAGAMGPGAIKPLWDACEALAGSAQDEDGDEDANRLPQMVLSDMRDIMGTKGRIATEGLLTGLALLDGRPWANFDHGRPLSSRGLVKLLSGFGIRPKTVKLADGTTAKGYQRADCTDAWARYLPAAAVADIDTLMAQDAASRDGMF